MKNRENKIFKILTLTFELVKLTSVLIVSVSLIISSCKPSVSDESFNPIIVEAANDSLQIYMSITPNEVGKIKLDNRFIGLIPRKTSKNEDKVDVIFVENPKFDFEEFTFENVKSNKLRLGAPKEISSLDELGQLLNSYNLGYDNFVASKKVDASVNKDGILIVKNLESKTTVTCACPCSVSFGKVSYGCN